MLRNEVGWFDEEENSADNLSMRLANDATFVRAAFSNRLSIFIQDSAAVIVAVLIGMFLQWRLALVALATLPILMVSAIAQVLKFIILLINGYASVLHRATHAYPVWDRVLQIYALHCRMHVRWPAWPPTTSLEGFI